MSDFVGYPGLERQTEASRSAPERTACYQDASRMASRFWSRVDKSGPMVRSDLGPCWLWTGHTNGKGYGQISVLGRKWQAHCLAYTALVGPVPSGLELDHLCRVKLCVNPAHLEPVTHAENIRRAGGAMKNGGLARAAALTPERRSEISRTAALARWSKATAAALLLALALEGCATAGVTAWSLVCGDLTCGVTLPQQRLVCPAGVDPKAVTWCRIPEAGRE